MILFWKDKNLAYLLEEIYTLIYQYSKVFMVMALGQKSKMVNEAYSSALEVYSKHSLLVEKKIVTHEDLEKGPMLHLLDHSNELKWAIRSGSMNQVREQLEEIFSLLDSRHTLSLEQVQVWEDQFEQLRNNWLKEYEIRRQDPFYQGLDYWREDGSFSFRKFKEEKRRNFKSLSRC